MHSKSSSIKPSGIPARKNLSMGLMGLAVASTLIASTCCVLPLVLVLVGITGAWMVNLTAMRPLTPFFTGIALIALAWAGVLIFRPSAACSYTDGSDCDKTRPVTKTIFLVCAVFIALLMLFPLIAPYFY